MINFNNTYTSLPRHFYKKSSAQRLKSPSLLLFNHRLAKDMFDDDLSNKEREELAAYFSGQIPHDSMALVSTAYSGHQFGHFNPILGDGRAVLLGEILSPHNKRFDVQLKGCGKTPFSRNGDGLSSIGPVIREYIVSEAMFSLGVPTTRSLSVIATGELVYREQAYPGGILTRIASSHIRIGTFEYLASLGDLEGIKTLTQYTIKRHFPHLLNSKNLYLDFIRETTFQIAEMVSHWMSLGFIHGVMNTDNMSICGETLDYGPCAFMDNFRRDKVFSSIDRRSRYAYNNQINIAKWNITRLASCFIPLVSQNEDEAEDILRSALNSDFPIFEKKYEERMLLKLGLKNGLGEKTNIINALFDYLEKDEKDFTETFKNLEHEIKNINPKESQFHKLWSSLLSKQSYNTETALNLMTKKNPFYTPRNHLIEKVIETFYEDEKSGIELAEKINRTLENPYTFQESAHSLFKAPKPDERVYQTFCGT